MWELLQGHGIWAALDVAVLAMLLILALPGHHPCVCCDMAEEAKRELEGEGQQRGRDEGPPNCVTRDEGSPSSLRAIRLL